MAVENGNHNNNSNCDNSCDLQEEEEEIDATTTTVITTSDNNNTAANGSNNNNSNNNNNNKDIIIPNCCISCGCRKDQSHHRHHLIRLNQNVLLQLILAVLYGISDSLWSGTVFVAFLKRWSGGQNYLVGNVEAVNGLAVLLSALPVGYLADVYGRSRVIRAGGILIAMTAISHMGLLVWMGNTTKSNEPKSQSQWTEFLLSMIMAMWGIGGGIVTGPTDALYADSTPAGERSKYYHYLFVCYMLASCCGPLMAIILFQTMGDDWDLYHLQVVMFVGLSMEFCNALLMMLFDDSKALDENIQPNHSNEDEEGAEQQAPSRNVPPQQEPADDEINNSNNDNDNNTMDQLRQPLLSDYDTTNTTTTITLSSTQVDDDDDDDEQQQQQQQQDGLFRRRQRRIPYILFFASLVMAIGSGMTIKFFPLFFKDQVGFSPTQVQGIYVLAPLTMAIFSSIGTYLSRWLGRVQTILLFNTAGVASLLAMVLGFDHYFIQHKYQLVVLYLLRTAFMNGTYPLYGSILMDFVPKQERARWKSLESISQFGWCGSAALGGYISDRYSYNHTFGLTALLQGMGVFFIAFLLPLVPRKEQDLSIVVATNTAATNETANPPNHDTTTDSTITRDGNHIDNNTKTTTMNGCGSSNFFDNETMNGGDTPCCAAADSNTSNTTTTTTTTTFPQQQQQQQ